MKNFLKNHGIWVLFAGAVIAAALALMSFFNASPLVDITGILAEPWHIRYVGTEHSLPMRQQNLCLEEYIAKYGSN